MTPAREAGWPGAPGSVAASLPSAPPAAVAAARFGVDKKLLRLWAASTALCGAVVTLMVWLGIPGWDTAAHLYKAELVHDGYSIFWDNYWYGGSYGSVNYGFVYYWLVQAIPAAIIITVAAGLVPVLFLIYQRRLWGIDDVWPAWSFAAVMGMYLAHGQDPFILSLAMCLGGLALLARGRPGWGALPVAVSVFVNPMGLVVTSVLMGADVLARPETRRRYAVLAALLAPVIGIRFAMGVVFAEPGNYLNETSQMLIYLGFALAGVALAGVNATHARRPFIILFLLYAAVCLCSFVTPQSPLGNNVGRFFLVFGLPLMLLLRHSRLRRPFTYGELVVIPIVLFALLQMSTPLDHYFSRDELPQTKAAFFAPALEVAGQLCDEDHRIHVVALRRHWEALYFPAAGFPITRGWYRQADAIHNGIFYGDYDAAEYAAWLRRMGVEYVFLANAPLDPWSEHEARLLEDANEFTLVRKAGAWTVYGVSRPEGMVVGLDGGTGHLTHMGHRSFGLTVDRPGTYLVKCTWTPYWRLVGDGTLTKGRDGFVSLRAPRAGAYVAVFEFTPQRALACLTGRAGG